MGKSAYAQCGQDASVGGSRGVCKNRYGSTALLHLRSTAFRKCEEGYLYDKKDLPPLVFAGLRHYCGNGILAMTANAFLEDMQKSKEAGMDEHLSKPVDISALEQVVKRFRVTPPRK